MKNMIVEIEGVSSELISIDIKRDLEISEDIEREIKQAASRFGYMAVCAEEAESRFEKASTAYDIWKAKQERELIEENGGKQFKTAAELHRKLYLIPKYANWQSTLNKYKKDWRMCKIFAKAFEHKKDMVQTIAANRRAERS